MSMVVCACSSCGKRMELWPADFARRVKPLMCKRCSNRLRSQITIIGRRLAVKS